MLNPGLAQIIDEAHDLLLADGWIQLRAKDARTGARCASQAIVDACKAHADEVDDWINLRDAAYEALAKRPAHVAMGAIMNWNDGEERTYDEVLDRFRNVAKELRNNTGANPHGK